jgi:hypothetical protein
VLCNPQPSVLCNPQRIMLCNPQPFVLCNPQRTVLCNPQPSVLCNPQRTMLCNPQPFVLCNPQLTVLCNPQPSVLHSSIRKVQSFRRDDCDTNHYLVVATVRERLALSKQTAQKLDVERFNFRNLNDLEVRTQHQIKMSNR